MTDAIFTLAALGPAWLGNVLLPIFVVVCIIMVLVVLIQKPQGGGLAGAFGGSSAGSGQTAFGTKTGDALTLFTVGVFVLFVILAILLNLAMKAPKLSPEAAVQSTSAPASETGPTSETTPAADTSSGGLPGGLPTALPVAPSAELPANVTTPATPAPAGTPADAPEPQTTPAPAPAPAQPGTPKPDGGF
jgi:preprotein translocase subunit SecG